MKNHWTTITISLFILLFQIDGYASLSAALAGEMPPLEACREEASPTAGFLGARQDSWRVLYKGQIGGIIRAIAIQGDYAYIGEGSKLTILDISNPELPIVKGESSLFPGTVQGIGVDGIFVYLATAMDGLRILDASNPSNLVEVGYYENQWKVSANGVSISGNYAYIAAGHDGLRIVDVSDPTHPEEVGVYETDVYDVEIANEFAYIASRDNLGYGYLRVLNVSVPSDPVEIGSHPVSGGINEVAVSGDYAFIIGTALYVLDVSVPDTPIQVGHIELTDYPYATHLHGLAVMDGQVLVGAHIDLQLIGGFGGMAARDLRVIDVSNPSLPVQVGIYETHDYVWDVAVYGDYSYTIDGDRGLRVVEMSEPTRPIERNSYNPPGFARDVALSQTHAYVTDGYGLRVIDEHDPRNPVEIGTHEMSGDPGQITTSEGYAYVMNGHGLQVIDVHNPTSPEVVSTFSIPYPGKYPENQGIFISGNYAYLTGNNQLWIVDVSDPSNSVEISSLTINAYDVHLVEQNGYIYYTGDERLGIVDVRDPENPVEAGSYEFPVDFQSDLAIDGSYLYVTTHYPYSVRIFDVSEPANPVEAGFYYLPEPIKGIAISEGYAFVNGGRNAGGRLWVLDVRDPYHPYQAGYYYEAPLAYAVAAQGYFAYQAGVSGLVTLQYKTIAPYLPYGIFLPYVESYDN